MVLASHPLWLSLRELALDDPAHASNYSTRLRHEQGWSASFTSRVVNEYRRFLFLTATHDELVVPSDAVDQAWHLHMLDTRAYWDDLCGRVLGRPIHHTPSRGGGAENARHRDAYEATLRRYGDTFGEAPPADIWPSAHERFAGRYRRVDTRQVWMIPKRFVTGGAVAAAAAGALAGCSSETASVTWSMGILVAVLIMIVWGAHLAADDRRRRDDRGGCGGGFGGGDCDGGCGGGCG